VPPGSALVGQTLEESNFRQRFGLIVLALRRGESTFRTDLETIDLREGDVLLVQGPRTQADRFRGDPDLTVSDRDVADVYHLEERLMLVRVPQNSALAGKTLNESRMGSAYGLGVLGIVRGETTHLMPRPEEQLQAQDLLVIKGEPEDLRRLEAFQDLEIDQQMEPDVSELESAQVGLVEVVLSPRTTLAGRSLRELHFREKYGLSVLAIWRQGQVHRANLSDMPLRFGDALLLHGPRHRLRVLGSEPDFLVLTEAAQEPPRVNKAPLALLIMAVVLGPVILGWIPIAIAAVMGVALMILTGCLTMDEAYRSIEWKAVFLIAGMLPLGIAMEQTGAASFLAEQMVRLVGGFGPLAVTAGLFILAALASQAMPNPAVAVLLAPVALNTATDLGISPYPLMMAIAISASAAFLSPVGHPSNVLIMGPGGYRFSDFTKVGMPMTVMVLVVVLLILPFVWPF
jgi:di/tricarboxylate transporter